MKRADLLRELKQIDKLIDNMEIVGRNSRIYQMEAFKRLEQLIDKLHTEKIEDETPIIIPDNQPRLL